MQNYSFINLIYQRDCCLVIRGKSISFYKRFIECFLTNVWSLHKEKKMCQQASQKSHWLCASVTDIGCQQTTLRQHTVPTSITSNHLIVACPPCSHCHTKFAHLILKKSFITEVKLSSATVEDFAFTAALSTMLLTTQNGLQTTQPPHEQYSALIFQQWCILIDSFTIQTSP